MAQYTHRTSFVSAVHDIVYYHPLSNVIIPLFLFLFTHDKHALYSMLAFSFPTVVVAFADSM